MRALRAVVSASAAALDAALADHRRLVAASDFGTDRALHSHGAHGREQLNGNRVQRDGRPHGDRGVPEAATDAVSCAALARAVASEVARTAEGGASEAAASEAAASEAAASEAAASEAASCAAALEAAEEQLWVAMAEYGAAMHAALAGATYRFPLDAVAEGE